MPIIIGGGSANGITSFSSPATFQSTLGVTGTLTAPAVSTGGTVGTQGQILASTGSASTWVNGWTLINTTTVSAGAAIQDTTSLTSTYTNYMIVINNLLTATNAVTTTIQLQSGGAFKTTGYGTVCGLAYNSAMTSAIASTGFLLGVALRNSNTYPSNWVFYISNPSSTTTYKTLQGTGSVYDTGFAYYCAGLSGGSWTGGTGAITGLQIVASSGNISGTVQVYGSN